MGGREGQSLVLFEGRGGNPLRYKKGVRAIPCYIKSLAFLLAAQVCAGATRRNCGIVSSIGPSPAAPRHRLPLLLVPSCLCSSSPGAFAPRPQLPLLRAPRPHPAVATWRLVSPAQAGRASRSSAPSSPAVRIRAARASSPRRDATSTIQLTGDRAPLGHK